MITAERLIVIIINVQPLDGEKNSIEKKYVQENDDKKYVEITHVLFLILFS
jgi:hypothetical protein